jgi:hypothetical protein
MTSPPIRYTSFVSLLGPTMAGEMFPDDTGDDGFGMMAILLLS